MSRSPSEGQIALTVRAADRLSEIFLADSRFELVASGVGSVEAKVGPGLYKARFRCGQTQTDSLIEVEAGAENKLVVGPKVQFATPLPLPDTITWRQEHEEAARKLSRSAGLKKGGSSGIFLCCRGLSEEASRPWTGMSLHDLSGKLLAEAAQGECDVQSGFFALNLEVDPGTYRLQVEEEPGEIYEMFVVTLAGWQTQVFALAENAWLPGVDACRAALPTTSVLMAELGKGFDPADAAVRQTELLRLGLLHGRKILTEAGVKELLAGPTLNPMTAIFAVHLLLRQEESAALAAEMAVHIASPLAAHPDIRAAVLPIIKAAEPPVFPNPPMLSCSWQLIMQAVGKEQAEIPPGTLNDQLRTSALGTALWLMQRPD